MSTWDWRHSAKSSTVAIRARFIGRGSAGRVSGVAGLWLVNWRHSEGSWVSTIRKPPAATPRAAERTPQRAPKAYIPTMMPMLYAT